MDIIALHRWVRGRGARISALVLIIISLGILMGQWFFGPRDDGAQVVTVIIPEGTGAAGVARILQDERIIRSSFAFSVYATLTGRATALQAGRYELCACQSVSELVSAIASGRALSDDVQITIPEGMNIWEIDRVLADADLIQAGELRNTFADAEGRLFPETYRFAKDATAEDIVLKMEAAYFANEPRNQSELIVASILEKEAKSAEDMARVAGIIRKRMDIGMALQVDATVGYGWCLRTRGYGEDCDVTRAPIATEIAVDGPYNTYTRTGLPAGPISNPGQRALEAAANPTPSDYLFYLSTRDGSQLIYSRTLEEHLTNRLEYLGF